MEGYDICRQLRRSPQREGVPIVMLTAKDDPVHRIRARTEHRRHLAWLEEQLGNTKGAIAHYQDQRSQARLAFLQGL